MPVIWLVPKPPKTLWVLQWLHGSRVWPSWPILTAVHPMQASFSGPSAWALAKIVTHCVSGHQAAVAVCSKGNWNSSISSSDISSMRRKYWGPIPWVPIFSPIGQVIEPPSCSHIRSLLNNGYVVTLLWAPPASSVDAAPSIAQIKINPLGLTFSPPEQTHFCHPPLPFAGSTLPQSSLLLICQVIWQTGVLPGSSCHALCLGQALGVGPAGFRSPKTLEGQHLRWSWCKLNSPASFRGSAEKGLNISRHSSSSFLALLCSILKNS